MADTKVSALTSLAGADVVTSTDVLPIVDTSASQTKKITVSELGIAIGLPPGVVQEYAGVSEPLGWLYCYGQAISRTTYAGLFAAISTHHGAGDTSTTFNVPDIRGRVVAGKDDMGGSSANRLTNQSGGLNGDTLGATGGAETHTLTIGQLPSGFTYPTESFIGDAIGGAQTLVRSPQAGGGAAHNNVQPTIVLNYIIKT